MSDAPEDERDPRPVSAGQRGRGAGTESRSAARIREPGRPASRAEATGRAGSRHRIGIRELRQHASVYVDSSALVKLALTGPESAELADWLAERDGQPLVSSVLHRAEVPRAVWQAEPGALPRSYKVIKRIARVALSPDVLDDSATLPPQDLSPAQAIHLASALAVKRDLTAFVSYDELLLAAARDAGLPIASPGSP